MALIYNATFDKNTRKLSFEDKAGNEIYSFTVPERVTVDDITKPLTFKAIQDGSSVTLTKSGSPNGGFQTSRDGGNTWTDYTLDTAIPLNIGDKVSFRGYLPAAQSNSNYFSFQMTGKIEAWHNVMSLYHLDDFATNDTTMEYEFYHLFYGCTSLTKAPVLPATTLVARCYTDMFHGCTSLTESPELPATTLADYCYAGMFNGCTSLVNAPVLPVTTLSYACYSYMFQDCTSLTESPELPATTLADFCYSNMFQGCTSLTKAPVLPATTLDSYCYAYMFSGCTSLVNAPVLPATTLAARCYRFMFDGCTSLTKAPELPATTLDIGCYESMFSGCTSLTKAPVLSAITLVMYCYESMFNGCTSLTKAPELPANTLSPSCYKNMFNGCSSLNEVRCQIPSSYTSSNISSNYASNWLNGVSPTGTFYTNADANWPSGASGIPTGWSRVNEVAKDDIAKPLTFKATQDGSTVKLTKYNFPSGSFQTSRDGGNTWEDYTIDTAISLNTGDEVSFRAKSDRTSAQNANNHFQFKMTGKIEAWHNVMSLYRTNDFATYESVVEYGFSRLFNGCTSLTKAPALPATTLADYCYNGMFTGCTSLTKAPELPATTLVQYCYTYMFSGCTSLVNAPVLPATTLAQYCYRNMFSGCTSLTKAPALPATTLAYCCYYSMFYGCTSLTEAPDLPVTTLATSCYKYMFYGCTSLTKAPALPATTLIDSCYDSMFNGCTSLTEAPELSATTLANYCYNGMFKGCSRLNEVHCNMPSSYSSDDISSTYASNWLSNVSSTGTFYTNADANWPSGTSGIPTGWRRVNEEAPAVDDITKPLTFKATQDGSKVTLTKVTLNTTVKLYVSFETSTDGGNTWTNYNLGTAITLNTGDEVSFRTKSDRTSPQSIQSSEKYLRFEMTGKIEAWHNVMSLYRTSDFATYDPTTAIGNHWFYELFASCTSLTKAPALPATRLADSCYATMFAGCTSLKEAPELPATTLAQYCYHSMFSGCTSLTKAPELTTTTLANRCYMYMFRGCSSLNEVRCKIPSSYSSEDIPTYTGSGGAAWLDGVSSTGKFYTNADANWPTGASGIPEGWTRVNT